MLLKFLWQNPDIPNESIPYLVLREAVSISDLERVAALESATPNLSRLSLCSDIIAGFPDISRFTPKEQDLASKLLERLRRSGLRCALKAALEARIDPRYKSDNIDYPLEDPKPNTGPDVLGRVADLFENHPFFKKRNASLPIKKQIQLVGSLAACFARPRALGCRTSIVSQ